MTIDILPPELLLHIFEYDLPWPLRPFPMPTFFDVFYARAERHAQVKEKVKRRRRIIQIATVCKAWNNAIRSKIFEFVALPYSSPEAVIEALARVRRNDYGSPNGSLVRSLYIGSDSMASHQLMAIKDIIDSCTRLQDVTISKFLPHF